MNNIKDRTPKKLIPKWNENVKSKSKVVVFYHPTTLGEWEEYAADSKTQIKRIFENHVEFEGLIDPETNQEIATGKDLMASTYAPFRHLMLEVTAWILGFMAIPIETKKK